MSLIDWTARLTLQSATAIMRGIPAYTLHCSQPDRCALAPSSDGRTHPRMNYATLCCKDRTI
jgi:hypothetical protein